MNVYKRDKSGPYWYRFNYKGQRIRKSSGVYNKQDAKDIASAYRTQLCKGEVGIEEPEESTPIPRFKQAMEDFLECAMVVYAAHPATSRRYQTSSKALLAFFNSSALDQIKSEHVERFKLWRMKQKKLAPVKKIRTRGESHAKTTHALRPATINRELACLKHLFKRNESILPQNPVKSVKFLDEDNQQTRVLNVEEEKLYLLAASQPLQDIATLMVETGMRPEEVYHIRRENVHIDQGYLFNPYGKTKAARRQIPLSNIAAAVLSKRLAAAKNDYLFPGRIPAGGKPEDAGPIVKVNAAHTAAVKRSKVAMFRLYDLRHTWATRMVQAGVDLVTLAAMLGHSKINMVMRYAHPTQEHQFAAMEKMQRYMVK
jgi:integrase